MHSSKKPQSEASHATNSASVNSHNRPSHENVSVDVDVVFIFSSSLTLCLRFPGVQRAVVPVRPGPTSANALKESAINSFRFALESLPKFPVLELMMFKGQALCVALQSYVLATAALSDVLFSSDIPNKVVAAFNTLPAPIQYPQYTDTSAGKWLFFSPNTWTSGFFPATAYAMNTRQTLCGSTPANGLAMADWVSLGRSASNGLLSLNANSGIGHDVGFISFPFVEELAM